MTRKQKIYPAHPCVSCLVTTTNRTFCDACQKILKHPTMGYTASNKPDWRELRIGGKSV